MLKALVIKELRESAGIVVLALLGGIYVLGNQTGTPVVPWQYRYLPPYPFINDSFGFFFWLVAGGLAIAIGFRQTAWELGQGTYFFLFHRPIRRSRIFALKLIIGGVLVMLLSALLIWVYAEWAATPGHFAAPFEWSMTRPAWIRWVALPPLYIGAFLSGIRPGRWYGTRLVPLVAGIGVALLASVMPWFWAALGITIIGAAFGLMSVFYYIGERDY